MLLFMACMGLLASLFVSNPRIRSCALLWNSGAGSTVVVIQLFVEGYRIQLVFLYGLPVLMLLLSLFNLLRTQTAVRRESRIRRVWVRLLLVFGLIATAGLNYAFPVFRLPAPTGKLSVGTQVFHLTDLNREETFGESGSGKRELMIQVWYPAESGNGKSASLIPDSAILPYMAENYGLPGFTFHHLKYVSGHAYPAAKVSSAQTSYPLILASPGFGSSRFLHTSQAENLASHGYIVAVIDHTYNTFATEFPDGRITTAATNDLFSPDDDYRTGTRIRDKLGEVLTADVAFVLDQFELIQSGQLPSGMQGRIDLKHVGVFGHSIGGATAYNAAYDPRITAGIDLDGGLYRLRDRERLRKPFLFLNSESYYHTLQTVMDNRVYTDEELQQMGKTREWMEQEREDKKRELERMRESVPAGGEFLYIEHTEHLNFTDVQYISPVFKLLGITGELAPERASSLINAYMLDFFDLYLKNKAGALMKGPASRFPEVKFVTPLQ